MDNKFKILLYLAKKRSTFTLLDLSKKVSIPYTSFLRNINEMSGLVNIEKKGKSKLISINQNEITTAHLTIASYKEFEEFTKNNQVIKKIAEKSKDITMLFGSYAKKKQTKHSDIDILIINNGGEKNNSFTDISAIYDKEINPIFISKDEFKLMFKEKTENVVKQALKNHILLSGYKEFWDLIENENK